MNTPVPGPLRESVKCAEQNLLVRARELVGDRDPRQHELTLQMRAFGAARSGGGLGLPVLLALCSALPGKSLGGGLVAVGGLNLGGGLDPIYNAATVAELAVERGASVLLIPISTRRQLNDLSDEMAMRLTVLYYADATLVQCHLRDRAPSLPLGASPPTPPCGGGFVSLRICVVAR